MVAMMFQACKPALFFSFHGIVNLLLFSTYTLTTGNPLTPAIVFTTITLMSNARLITSAYMLNAVVGFQESKVALGRIQASAHVLYSYVARHFVGKNLSSFSIFKKSEYFIILGYFLYKSNRAIFAIQDS